jgi:signal transduction histidine kinase
MPKWFKASSSSSSVAAYIVAIPAVALATVTTVALRGLIGPSVSILFFPTVIMVAMYGGYGPALFATLLSTTALAFFLVPPFYSFHIGVDDVIRLAVFAVVAVVTASISSARARAEESQKQALAELSGALSALRKVSGWPLFVDVSLAVGAGKLLAHAASVVGCARAVAVWEAEEEPWVYVAESGIYAADAAQAIARYPPTLLAPLVDPALEGATFVSADTPGADIALTVWRASVLTAWRGSPVHRELAPRLVEPGLASATFAVEHLKGRMFFSGARSATPELIPLVEVVVHEAGNSLERLYLQERLHQIAIREDRIRVARDLHDGVLQSLTGIRLRLQALADEPDAPVPARDRLLALERAIAIEQREIRLFIDDLKPADRPVAAARGVAQALEELRGRLAVEWNTPISVRVSPADLPLPASAEQTFRLLVREAVVNALKHAHPSRVSVDVQAHGVDGLHVVVSDDGRGFPFHGRLEHRELVTSGVGPVSLRERLASFGGSLAIESMPTGSRVEITLPIGNVSSIPSAAP